MDEKKVINTQKLLKIVYGLLPIAAGLDKFTNILTNWSQYLSPSLANLLPVSPTSFMMVVGIIEIVAGIIVLSKWTVLGAYLVMIWLFLIAINLIILGLYDIAVRDIVMAFGALSLAKLTEARKN